MTFFSIKFLIFLVIIFVGYYAIPSKYRYLWLLAGSYFFYASWNIKYTAVLLLITFISYAAAYQMKKWNKKICLSCGIAISLIILLLFKFWNFWAQGLCSIFGISDPATGGIISLVAPIGLSFFVLEAIGYMVDVYRGTTECETNIGRYALYISFFPNVLSGPIERSTNLLQQIKKDSRFSYEQVKHGLLLILWGYFLKLLIANRLSTIVNAAFTGYMEQTGATMLIAVILYGIQLYADFAGYSAIAIGIAETLGFSLIQNFKQPYFAQNIKDFWGRWHISLSSWLRDYVYIPLGGNRKGKFRQCINLMITFLVSGIWHGTGWQFVVWGAIHGVYQAVGKLTDPFRTKLKNIITIKRDCFSYKLSRAVITFALVDFAWLFFRASSLREAVTIIYNIIFNFDLGSTISGKAFLMGFDETRFYILLIEVLVLLVVDFLHEMKKSIVEWLNLQNKLFRWLLYIAVGMILIIGIINDYGLEVSTFIYTQF